jgi:signal transduction histidine kinase
MRISSSIKTDSSGFADVARIHATIEREPAGEVAVDCSRLRWLDANMCAPLAAAILAPGRRILLQKLHPAIETILRKNGFVPGPVEDTHGTTIRCQQFDIAGSVEFASYVEQNFRGKGLPAMSVGLQREFRRSIFELFENAVTHSKTELGIFACGQFFPTRRQLHFSLADRGVGIPATVREFLSRDLSATQAIEWAMSGQNTTRRVADRVPGGLGLKIMRDFIAENGGALSVASENGFWWLRGSDVGRSTLPAKFPGTAVDIEINTADSKMYQLVGELDPSSIF